MRHTMTLLLFTTTIGWSARAAESHQNVKIQPAVETISVRDFFARLPPGAFDSTNEGMSTNAKAQLLKTDKGGCWQWKTIDESTAELSCPKGDALVTLHIFPGIFVNVLGTSILSGINSSLSFWTGSLASDTAKEVDILDEPKLADFLGRKAPWGAPRIVYSYAFNPSFDITVEPYTWKEKFWTDHPIVNAVSYVWNGLRFEKRLQPQLQGH